MPEPNPSKIVIGEPSPMVGKILRDKLVREGHEVEWISEVPEIESALRDAPPHLLILNAMLPEGDGIRIFEGLRQPGSALPFPVVMTYDRALYPEEADRIEGLHPTAVIPLPFKPTEVARRVREILRAH